MNTTLVAVDDLPLIQEYMAQYKGSIKEVQIKNDEIKRAIVKEKNSHRIEPVLVKKKTKAAQAAK